MPGLHGKKVFIGVVDKHMPCCIVKIRNKLSAWHNSNIKQGMFKCDWLKKKPSKSCSSEDWAACRQQRRLGMQKNVFIKSKLNML